VARTGFVVTDPSTGNLTASRADHQAVSNTSAPRATF
jgi:hypothetical protein